MTRRIALVLSIFGTLASAATASFTADTTTALNNPERGLYYALNIGEFCNGFLQTVRDGGVDSQPVRIVQIDINLTVN